MTAPATRRSPATRSESRSRRSEPKLKVVDVHRHRRSRRRRTIVSASTVALAITLFATAILYGRIVEGQRHIDQLRADIAAAEAERARLERDIAVASTPDAIVARAIELGMVRAQDPQYLVAVRSVDS